MARILVWNKGRQTIDRTDLNTLNPLKIEARGATTILDATTIQVNSSSGDVKLSLHADGGAVDIAFAYLDQGHGAVFQVIHTGTSASDLTLIGDIKSVRTLRRLDIRPITYLPLPTSATFDRRLTATTRRWAAALIFVTMGTSLVVVGAFAALREPRTSIDAWLLAALPFMSAPYFYRAYRLWRDVAPPGLHAFHDDPVDEDQPPNTPLQPTSGTDRRR